MTSNFLTPVLGRASDLGVSLFEDTDPVELQLNSSPQETEIVIRAVYRQVLGNAYVMESERLTVEESKLKGGEISVRDFVRKVALSDLYRSRFFDNCPRYRAIELNFKHLLGRAPEGYQEMVSHSQILDQGGFEAEIDSYLDSDEYQENFGDFLVPYYRGYKTMTGKSMVGFTHLFKLLRGASSSDKNLVMGNYSRLNPSIIEDSSNAVVPPSSIWSYGGVTDIEKLLSVVLQPKKSPQTTVNSSTAPIVEDSSLVIQCQEQQEKINQLQQKRNELQRVATIGVYQLGSNWQNYSTQSSSPNVTETSDQSLQQKSEQQQLEIATLEKDIAQLQSLATIGEARLNKWRRRSFS